MSLATFAAAAELRQIIAAVESVLVSIITKMNLFVTTEGAK
jgi:hypothetical protein